MASNKTKLPRDKKEWIELCAWIELNIFNYSNKQKLQTNACYVLDGLRKGQHVANNFADTNGEYPLEVILLTFKANKNKILKAIQGKDFASETSKMSYVCAIVRDQLNDMSIRYFNAKKSQEKVETINTDIMEYQGAEYKSKTNGKQNKLDDKYKDLW